MTLIISSELRVIEILFLLLNLLVAIEKWKYPDPIPNLEVKNFIADNTTRFP
tara:strand:- start:137 stop:292 length:156 start_codon:yes stop_codon:yes gene_type:complete